MCDSVVFRVKAFKIIMLCKRVSIDIIRFCWRPQPISIRAAIIINIIIFNRINMLLGCENPYNFNCFWD